MRTKKFFTGQQIKYVDDINCFHNFGGTIHTATITQHNQYYIKLDNGTVLYNSHNVIAVRFEEV